MIADAAGFMKGMTTDVTWDVALAISLFFGMAYFLWHTPLGLRLRFSGERPSAADSLGVSVHKMRYIGMAIANSVTLLSLPCVVLGGGGSEALGKPWLKLVRSNFEKHVFPDKLKDTKIVLSELEDNAGPIGAALLAADSLK